MAVTFCCTRARVSSGCAARCKYVNRIWPGRSQPTSSPMGSLTLTIMSACWKTSRASSTSRAPAAAYCSSEMPLPTPAPRCTTTVCPARVSSSTPAGVMATRFSPGLISFGTPMIMTLAPRSSPPLYFAHFIHLQQVGGARLARAHAGRDDDAVAGLDVGPPPHHVESHVQHLVDLPRHRHDDRLHAPHHHQPPRHFRHRRQRDD